MTIDDVRSYWSARPCNIKHSPLDIDIDPLGYSKGVTWRKYFVEPHIPRFAEFEKWKDKGVLELGCGIGTDVLGFVKAGATVTAVDISEKSIQIAAKRYGAEGLPLGGVLWIRGDIEKVVIPDNKPYDLVYSFGVIHHTPHPELAIQNAYKSLKSGGEFRLMLYHRKSTKVLRILMRHLLDFRRKSVDQIVALESEAQSGCPITHTYTKKAARELLESCGFLVEKMEVAHIFPYDWREYKEYRYRRGFPWNIIKGRLFNWLETKLGWHLLIWARKP